MFIQNSQKCYQLRTNITIDELFPSRTRCRFIQCLRNKLDKFRIKFWLASDFQTNNKYILNRLPCLGKDETRVVSQPVSEFVILKLIESYTMEERTITTDNIFTILSLASKLLLKRTTLVGIIRGNKKKLPKICKTKKNTMAHFSSLLYRSNGIILTIYKSKPKKVFVLNSKHKSVRTEKSNKCLPETVEFYNKTKFGVENTNQMVKKYSVKSGSRR